MRQPLLLRDVITIVNHDYSLCWLGCIDLHVALLHADAIPVAVAIAAHYEQACTEKCSPQKGQVCQPLPIVAITNCSNCCDNYGVFYTLHRFQSVSGLIIELFLWVILESFFIFRSKCWCVWCIQATCRQRIVNMFQTVGSL